MRGCWPSLILSSQSHWHSRSLVRLILKFHPLLTVSKSYAHLWPPWPQASLWKKYKNTFCSRSLHIRETGGWKRWRQTETLSPLGVAWDCWAVALLPCDLRSCFKSLLLSSSPSLSLVSLPSLSFVQQKNKKHQAELSPLHWATLLPTFMYAPRPTGSSAPLASTAGSCLLSPALPSTWGTLCQQSSSSYALVSPIPGSFPWVPNTLKPSHPASPLSPSLPCDCLVSLLPSSITQSILCPGLHPAS